MCQKIVRGLRVALSLAVFAAVGSPPQGGLDVLLEQIRTMGARQWLGVMAASLVPNALAGPHLADSLGRLLPVRAVAAAESHAGSPETV